jgi:hypothetical protein
MPQLFLYATTVLHKLHVTSLIGCFWATTIFFLNQSTDTQWHVCVPPTSFIPQLGIQSNYSSGRLLINCDYFLMVNRLITNLVLLWLRPKWRNILIKHGKAWEIHTILYLVHICTWDWEKYGAKIWIGFKCKGSHIYTLIYGLNSYLLTRVT